MSDYISVLFVSFWMVYALFELPTDLFVIFLSAKFPQQRSVPFPGVMSSPFCLSTLPTRMLLRWGLALSALVACLLCNSCCSSAVEVGDFAGGPQVMVEDSKLLTPPRSHDVVLLSPQYTLEVSGARGIMRFLLGFSLLIGTILYAALVTYPKAMPPFKDLFVHAKQVVDVVAGEVPRSKTEIIMERLQSYAERNPEEVFIHAAAFSTGLLLWLWGLTTLRRPRKARLVGI